MQTYDGRIQHNNAAPEISALPKDECVVHQGQPGSLYQEAVIDLREDLRFYSVDVHAAKRIQQICRMLQSTKYQGANLDPQADGLVERARHLSHQ